MAYKLSILIPTLEKRGADFSLLKSHLLQQKRRLKQGVVEIVELRNTGEKSIGFYRNALMSRARGEYIAFIDDDDWVDDNYIDCLLVGISTGADCCSLVGQYWNDGKYDRNFYHSLKYDAWYDDAFGYYRFPNHLNCIKKDLVKDIPFMEISHGEDSDWSMRVRQYGRLKTEVEIPVPIYIYRHISRK